jgi:urea transport system permease protein
VAVFPALLLAIVLAVPLISCPAFGKGIVLAEDVLASLGNSSVAKREVALDALAADDSPEATALLDALARGTVFVDRESGAILEHDEGKGEVRDVVTDQRRPVVDMGAFRRVGISTRQRDRIQEILTVRLLRSPDLGLRRKAVEALLGRPQLDGSLLAELLEKETDGGIRSSLEQGLALVRAMDPASSPEVLVKAVDLLEDSSLPQVSQTLERLRESPHPEVAAKVQEALRHRRIVSEWASGFETVFFGLSLGSVLILTSIGLAITFGVMGVINMAHGEFIMLGAYTVWGMQQAMPQSPGLALLLSIPAAFLVSGGAGVILERGVIRYLYGRPLETLLATFGISLILQQAVRVLISPQNRAVETPELMSGMWHVTGGFSLTCNRLYILCFCLAVFAMIYFIMHRTRLGLEVRAVTQNRAIARAMGINASRVDTLTFALGSGVAGMAGVALSQLTNVGPNLGQGYIVDSFMVVVFGGVGNLWGTLCGGLLLGLANKIIEPFSGAMLAKILLLAGLICFMQARPKGLFPERGRAADS